VSVCFKGPIFPPVASFVSPYKGRLTGVAETDPGGISCMRQSIAEVSVLAASAVALDSREASTRRIAACPRSDESTGFPRPPAYPPTPASTRLPSSHGIPKPSLSSPSEQIIESQQAGHRHWRAVTQTVSRGRKVLARGEACSSAARGRRPMADHPIGRGLSWETPTPAGGREKWVRRGRSYRPHATDLLPVSRTKNTGSEIVKNPKTIRKTR
jgi:hypothetical protein